MSKFESIRVGSENTAEKNGDLEVLTNALLKLGKSNQEEYRSARDFGSKEELKSANDKLQDTNDMLGLLPSKDSQKPDEALKDFNKKEKKKLKNLLEDQYAELLDQEIEEAEIKKDKALAAKLKEEKQKIEKIIKGL